LEKRTTYLIVSIAVLAFVLAAIASTRIPSLAESTPFLARRTMRREAEGARGAVPAMVADDTQAVIKLSSGFLLDPYLLRVIGDGDIEASSLEKGCAGYVDQAPDVILNWSGEVKALHLLVYSDMDPVLLVRAPDGSILCSDDATNEVLDPIVTLEDPVAGEYEIHVGAYESDEPLYGFLVITEIQLDEESLADLDLAPLLDRRDYPDDLPPRVTLDRDSLRIAESAVFGTRELSAGFGTISQTVAGGGDLPVFAIEGVDPECTGFASLVPSFSFDWQGDGSMTIYVESDANTSLVVVTPGRELVCSSDADRGNLNPAVQIDALEEGPYDVFVATSEPSTVVLGKLTLTEEADMLPERLGPDAGTTLYVGPYLVDCEGAGPQKCMLVRESLEEEYSLFYDQIKGFEYEEGYEYELRVQVEAVENPPADASSLRYTLIELVEQTPSMEGRPWVLQEYLDREGKTVTVLEGSEVNAEFREDQVAGNAGCNRYFGSYQIDGSKVTIGDVGMTRKFCSAPEGVMDQESDYGAALEQVASYQVTEEQLELSDAEGQVLLSYRVQE
jgi:heat shock protein HslJ